MKNLDFSVENMERRLMMAGDVSVRVAGGDLVVTGDAAGNGVVINGTSDADRFVVQGINNTTINGQESIEIGGVNDDFRINLRAGDNRLVLNRLPGQDTGFSTSQGGTATRRVFEVPDDLSIRTGSGNDIVLIGEISVGDDASISTGGGDDVAVWYEATIDGRLRTTTGSGNDLIGFSLTSVGDHLSATSGSGDDLILGLGYQVQGDSRISAGGGDDLFFISDEVVAGDETLTGGGGDDALFHMSNAFDDVTGDFRARIETQTQLSFIGWFGTLSDAVDQHVLSMEADQLREDYVV